MSSAPWWFVLVTALVTGGFTLSGSWLTAISNRKQKREELAHNQVLERDKKLHDRRIELYAELIPAIDRIMGMLHPDPQDSHGEIETDLDSVYSSFSQVLLVGSLPVRTLLEQLIRETEKVLSRGDSENLVSIGGVEFAANHLIWEMRIEIGAAQRDDDEEFEMRERYTRG